jgi:hypothetical protein
MQNDITQNLFFTKATIRQVKLNKYEPNCTKAEYIIPMATVLQHSTYKNKGTQGDHLKGGVAKAKSHHHHGPGIVPRR